MIVGSGGGSWPASVGTAMISVSLPSRGLSIEVDDLNEVLASALQVATAGTDGA